jgi:hypothetical protein
MLVVFLGCDSLSSFAYVGIYPATESSHRFKGMVFIFLYHNCIKVNCVKYFKLHAKLYKPMNIIVEAFGEYSEFFYFHPTYVVRSNFLTHAFIRILIYLVV